MKARFRSRSRIGRLRRSSKKQGVPLERKIKRVRRASLLRKAALVKTKSTRAKKLGLKMLLRPCNPNLLKMTLSPKPKRSH
jgi:hypothetical protein